MDTTETLKRSRFYIFGKEETVWWKNRNGNWKWSINNIWMQADCKTKKPSPWGMCNDKDIIREAEFTSKQIQAFTKEEYEQRLFLESI